MSRQEKHVMWSIGLTDEDAAFIAGCAGKGWGLTAFTVEASPSGLEFERDSPYLAWVAQSAWARTGEIVRQHFPHLGLLPHILILDADEDRSDLAAGPSPYILSRPLRRTQVLESLSKAVETRALHTDLLCMTRELLIDRDLLENKSATLSFLTAFLTDVAETSEPEKILNALHKNIAQLLPVTAVHGALWRDSAPELFLAVQANSAAEEAWRSLFADAARKLAPADCALLIETARVNRLDQSSEAAAALPEKQRVYLIPLSRGGKSDGVIAILAKNKPSLGKDQAAALRAATQHAALAMRRALSARAESAWCDSDFSAAAL